MTKVRSYQTYTTPAFSFAMLDLWTDLNVLLTLVITVVAYAVFWILYPESTRVDGNSVQFRYFPFGLVRRTTTLDKVDARFKGITIVIKTAEGACIRSVDFALWRRSLSEDDVLNALKPPGSITTSNPTSVL